MVAATALPEGPVGSPTDPPAAADAAHGRTWMPGVEALRGLAATAVAVFHLWALTSAPTFPGSRLIPGLGQWAVDLFFLLSGFLLVQTFWERPRRDTLAQYYVRRFARIAPAYYVCLAVLFLFLAQRERVFGEHGLTQVLANVTFTQWLSPTTSTSFDVSGVFWTLSVEMVLYASLPVLAWAVARRPIAAGASLFLLGMAYRLYVTLEGDALEDLAFRALPGHPESVMRLYLVRQFWGILPLFVIGMLLRWWLHFRPGAKGRPLDRVPARWLLALLVPSIVILPAVGRANDVANQALFVGFDVTVALLLVPALAYAGCTVGGWVSWPTRVLVWLGKRSYGIYLWHFPVILVAFDRGPFTRPADLSAWGVRLTVAVLATLVLGAVSYRWVELPSLRAGRRIASRVGRRGPPEPAGLAARG